MSKIEASGCDMRRDVGRGIRAGILVLLAVLLLSGTTDASLLTGDWVKYQNDINNTGNTNIISNSDGTLDWTYDPSGLGGFDRRYASVVVSNTNVYASLKFSLVSFFKNGTIYWIFNSTEYINTPCLDENENIYFGSGDGKFYSLSKNGTENWNYTTTNLYPTACTIYEDKVYVVFGDYLYGFYKNDGALLFEYNSPYGSIDSQGHGSPLIFNNSLYIGSFYGSGKLSKINAIDGSLEAVFDTSTTAYTGGSGIFDGETIYVFDEKNVYALYENNFTQKWVYTIPSRQFVSFPSYFDGTIYIPDYDGIVYILYASNGTLKSTINVGELIYNAVSLDGAGNIFIPIVTNYEGYGLWVYYPNGTIKYKALNYWQDVYSSPAIDSDGKIYVIGGTGGNNLYVISQAPPPPAEVTISCPIGWCYIASNYSSKTLLELDNLFSTDTIQGRYNPTTQKYESHRTGYSFNQNVVVSQKEGYYYYFSTATDITTTPGSTPSITLKQGWNLVGNYGSSARTLSALKTSIGVSATQAKYYDKSIKTWVSSNSQNVPAMEAFMVYTTSQTNWGD